MDDDGVQLQDDGRAETRDQSVAHDEPAPDVEPLAAEDEERRRADEELAEEVKPLVGPAERAERIFLQWPQMAVGMLLGLGVAILVIYLFAPHLSRDLHTARVATHEPVFLVVAFLCVLIYLAADAITLVLLVRVIAPTAAWQPLVLLALRAHFVGGATSFGGVEIPYQVFALRRQGLTLTASTSAVVVKGVIHSSLVVLVALAAFLPVSDSPITTLQRWLVLIAIGLIVAAWLVGSLWVRRPIGIERLPAKMQRRVHAFREAFAEFHRAGWRVSLLVTVAQVTYWAAMFSIIPLILYALGWRGPLMAIVTSQAVLQVLMPLSPLPGGAGIAELGYLALIGPSAPQSIRVSSLVLWRVATWAIPVTIGAVGFGLRGKKNGR